ncbi:MAG: POTRA domain-containing protein, partial [Gemmatimonadaceae bacterium]
MSLPFPQSAIVLGRVLLLSLAVLLAPRVMGAQSDTEEESPEVEKLILEGVKAVDEELLRESIATKESKCKSILLAPFCWVSDSKYFVRKRHLDRVEFRRDVVRVRVFYWKRGFRETQVDTTIVKRGDGVAVTFRITEGPPTLVSSVRVDRPEKLLSDRYLSRTIRPRAGQPFDLVVFDSTETHLRNELWEQGYSDAVILTEWDVVDSLNAAALRISIDPRWVTRVGRITIAGNEKVSQRTITRSLTLVPGDIFRRSEVLASQRNLYTSNLFSHAEITVSAADDSVKEIAVIVDEAPMSDVRVSGGFSTVDFAQAEARYTRYNWLGGARQLDLRGAVSNLLAPQLNGSFIF